MAEQRSLSVSVGNVTSVMTRVWTGLGHRIASIVSATHAVTNAGQCRAKSMTASIANVLNSKTCACFLFILYVSVGILAQAAYVVPFSMPWSPMVPPHVTQSLFDMCAERMAQRRLSPHHASVDGWNLNVVCVPGRILMNPRLDHNGAVLYTTSLGTREMIPNPDPNLVAVVNPRANPRRQEKPYFAL